MRQVPNPQRRRNHGAYGPVLSTGLSRYGVPYGEIHFSKPPGDGRMVSTRRRNHKAVPVRSRAYPKTKCTNCCKTTKLPLTAHGGRRLHPTAALRPVEASSAIRRTRPTRNSWRIRCGLEHTTSFSSRVIRKKKPDKPWALDNPARVEHFRRVFRKARLRHSGAAGGQRASSYAARTRIFLRQTPSDHPVAWQMARPGALTLSDSRVAYIQPFYLGRTGSPAQPVRRRRTRPTVRCSPHVGVCPSFASFRW